MIAVLGLVAGIVLGLVLRPDVPLALEPYLPGFARFEDGRGRDVLEIGVGMGADHLEWARARPRSLVGCDLTPHAIELTRARLALHELRSRLLVTNAERLPFRDASFDLVYSWGVIHHSPDTAAAVREIHRVLRPGGRARVMIYKRRSLLGANAGLGIPLGDDCVVESGLYVTAGTKVTVVGATSTSVVSSSAPTSAQTPIVDPVTSTRPTSSRGSIRRRSPAGRVGRSAIAAPPAAAPLPGDHVTSSPQTERTP